MINKNKDKQSFKLPIANVRNIHNFLTQDLFGNTLEETLSQNFGADINELIRSKQRSSHITISNNNKCDIKITTKLAVKSSSNKGIKTYTLNRFQSEKESKDNNTIYLPMSKYRHSSFMVEEIMDKMINNITHSSMPKFSYYLPAARAGILQGHKALSASVIQSASRAGIESMSSIPRLTGTVSDFIANVILTDRRKTPFFDIADQLEKEMLCGHTEQYQPKNRFPEIMYVTKNYEIPIHRTSSTISEIAPISMYLKYTVRNNSLIIIEEPKAHLHPENQVIFAKYIVKMIRAGLNLLITTHSVFLLEQIGKYMIAGNIESKRRNTISTYKEDYLLSDEVSPYVFVNKSIDNHVVKPVEMNNDDGISQEEFVKVANELYSESVRLQKYSGGI